MVIGLNRQISKTKKWSVFNKRTTFTTKKLKISLDFLPHLTISNVFLFQNKQNTLKKAKNGLFSKNIDLRTTFSTF